VWQDGSHPSTIFLRLFDRQIRQHPKGQTGKIMLNRRQKLVSKQEYQVEQCSERFRVGSVTAQFECALMYCGVPVNDAIHNRQ
jgi:hypothetical protein